MECSFILLLRSRKKRYIQGFTGGATGCWTFPQSADLVLGIGWPRLNANCQNLSCFKLQMHDLTVSVMAWCSRLILLQFGYIEREWTVTGLVFRVTFSECIFNVRERIGRSRMARAAIVNRKRFFE